MMNNTFWKMMVREAAKALVGSIASVTAMNAVDSAFRAADRRKAIATTMEQPKLNPYSFSRDQVTFDTVKSCDVTVSDDAVKNDG